MAAAALLLAAAVGLAGCSGGSSAGHFARASTSPDASGPASSGPSGGSSSDSSAPAAPSSPVPAASGSPAITPAALRQLIGHDTVVNNTANQQNDYSLLTHVDTGLEREQDRAYTKAGAVNGYRVSPFYSVGRSVAVPTTSRSSSPYAVAQVLVGTKAPSPNGSLPAPTSPQLSVYAKTPQGWRLANALGLAGVKHIPAFAAPGVSGVTSTGSTAGIRAASSRVLAVATSCVSQQTSAQVAKPASCGEITEARAVAGFHVTASLAGKRWPTYTVALADGSTLVIGAVDVSMQVGSAHGVQWQQGSIVTGLLGLKMKTNPSVRYGYAEQLVMSVALTIPAGGGNATVLGVETGDLSAHQVSAPSSGGGGVSV